ncbi:hypothetical protein HP15_3733 [Marinobacter adhaerens HP15]|uniref:Uncharacterized protein n=1 Tax=Marinobacter adhaerens (strain DSM 23420 / HP15) TaxID=225937 RepID=E4PI11_MARAH|nr:hypothetical protein HP15_3733 [Marinobacter adhaerens HP15]
MKSCWAELSDFVTEGHSLAGYIGFEVIRSTKKELFP